MEKYYFQNMNQFERKQALEDNCNAVEDSFDYLHHYSQEELAEKKDALSKVSIKIRDISTEKKAVNDQYKEQLKPLQNEHDKLISNIKAKGESVTETCYKFVDQEAGEVGFYNSKGELVEERDILPHERQMNIPFGKTGTNN